MANMIARLGVLLGIDSAEFTRGIEGANKKLQQFADSAVKYSTIGATALTAASVAAVRFADEISDIAKANDVAIDSVIKLRQALQDNGGEAENAGRMLSSFTAFVDKAADGGLEAQKTMTRLGVSLKDLGTLSIDELQNKLLVALQGIEDPITRNALAMEIFGKAAKNVDFAEMANSIENASDVTRQQAAAIEKAADVVNVFEKAWRDLMLMLATEIGGPLKQTISYIQSLQGETQIFSKIFEQTFKGVATLAMSAAFAMERFHDALFGGEGYQERSKQQFEKLKQQISDLYRGPDLRRGLDDPRIISGGASGPLRATKKAVDPEAERAKKEAERHAEKMRLEELKIYEIRNRQVELYYKTNQAISERQTLDSLTLDREQKLFLLEQQGRFMRKEDYQLAVDLQRIQANREDNIRRIMQETSLLEEDRQIRLANENELAQKAIDLAKEKNIIQKELLQGDYIKGFEQKSLEFFSNLPTQVQIGAEMFDSLMSNMSLALDRFVSSGKLSFKDLAKSIIQDLIRIQMRAQMTSLFSSLLGNMFTSVRYGTNIGSQQTSMLAAQDSWFRADGGPVDSGSSYIVGERGPELFVPKTNGTIIPNNQLSSSIAGQTNVTNNYINAIDAKSFEQRLLESSSTIWAANTYANKSLATNGRRA